MRPAHISTAPTYPNGASEPAVYEADGICHCDDPKLDPWGSCRRCFRLVWTPAESAA